MLRKPLFNGFSKLKTYKQHKFSTQKETSKHPHDRYRTQFNSSFYDLEIQPGFEENVKRLTDFVVSKRSLVVITGAGISTESGIPDYRGPNGSYKRGHKPMTYQEFCRKQNQPRYWARSMRAWRNFSASQPGPSHLALASLEKHGHIRHLITQNVDRLHHKAGQQKVTELHGTLYEVICLKCRQVRPREPFQELLEIINPKWILPKNISDSSLRADGDVETGLTLEEYQSFKVPECGCGQDGVLKPDVVFFGENCKREVVEECQSAISEADGVLVVGTSCSVQSVYRLITQASQNNTPISLVNMGDTRIDPLVNLKIEQPSGPLLNALNSNLM